jgi:hypothetical protein
MHIANWSTVFVLLGAANSFPQEGASARAEYSEVAVITEGQGALKPLAQEQIGLRVYHVKEVTLKADDFMNDVRVDLMFFNVGNADVFLRESFDVVKLELLTQRADRGEERRPKFQTGGSQSRREIYVRLRGGFRDSTGSNSYQLHGFLRREHWASIGKQTPGSSQPAILTVSAHAFRLGESEIGRFKFEIPVLLRFE